MSCAGLGGIGESRGGVGDRTGRPGIMTISQQIFWLLVLAIPIACAAWTVTHEEVFREPREYCEEKSQSCQRWYERKFFYLFTCEYCFSHYVTIFFLFLTRFKLLLPDWRGYLLAFFALVFIANIYMSLFGRVRLDIKRERVEIKDIEKKVEKVEKE
jgi:hypothetical protein